MAAELNFHQLRIFFAVARLRSFSRAARELRISQPEVSSQVRQFEEDLGAVLIDRVGRRVALTDAGRTVLEHAQRIFAISDEMVEAVESLRDLSHGRLSVAASVTIGEYILPPLLSRYRRTHPGIELSLDINPTRTVVDLVLQNEVDVGFVGDDVKQRGVAVTPFGTDSLVLIAPPSHPMADAVLGVDEIASLDYVMRKSGSAVRRVVDRGFADLRITPHVALEVSTNAAVKQSVMANLGVGILSRYAVGLEIEVGRLVELHTPDLQMQRSFNIVVRRDKQLSGAETAFIDMVVA
jgi:DNA-binding transcriptional LysR family regulator